MWLSRVASPGKELKIFDFRFLPGFESLERLLPLLRFTPQYLLGSLSAPVFKGAESVWSPILGILIKTTQVGYRRVLRTTLILPSPVFPTQDTQAADLTAGLVPIYSRPDCRPTGARYFKYPEAL